MNRRRAILRAALALLVAPILAPIRAHAQAQNRIYRIGTAWLADSATTRPYLESFLAGLRQHGIEVGRNLVVDVRNCDGDQGCLPRAVDELIALKPDLLAGIEQVVRVMRQKTDTIPILLTIANDPVAAGLARTLARPGGNVTGMASLTEVVAAKHVELLVEALPRLKTVAVLIDPGVPAAVQVERNVREAARAMRVEPVFLRVKDLAALEQAFADMQQHRPDALISASGSGMLFGYRKIIADGALRLRVPASGATSAQAEAGSLFGYGANLHDLARRSASHAARILRGANPGDIPIEQASVFELIVNLKTAKALGIVIPRPVLLRADRVIE